jgi:hypothetical protein
MTRYSRYVPPSDAEQDRSSDYVPHGDKYGGMDQYFAHDKDGKAIAMAGIFHIPGHTSTNMTSHNPYTGEDTLIAEGQRAHDADIEAQPSWHEGLTRPAQSGEQLVMFGTHHRPARSQVNELYARDSMAGKTAAMNLVGMADIASTTTTGISLQPSSSLSTHSKSLVDKLNKSGAISAEDMPKTIDNNGITFNYSNNKLDRYPHNNQTPSQDLTSRLPHAKARIRQAMGRSAPNLGTEPKSEQLQLEGFE